MNTRGYAYHYQGVGDDPPLSCNLFRILVLIARWFKGDLSPRELDELLNNLLYIRQKVNRWD